MLKYTNIKYQKWSKAFFDISTNYQNSYSSESTFIALLLLSDSVFEVPGTCGK